MKRLIVNDNLKHDIAYAGVAALLDCPWIECVSDIKATVAFDLYNALRAAQDAFEMHSKGISGLIPCPN